LIIALFSLLNLMPLGLVSRIQAGATLLKLAPLIIVTILTGFYFNSTLEYNWAHIDTLPATIPTVIFGYLGFEACCSLSHLLKDGPSSVGKVMLTAFFITAVLYMIFHFGLLQIMGPEPLAAEGAIGFPSLLGWPSSITLFLGIVIGGAILLSYANSLFGLSLGNITNIIAITRGSKIQASLIHGVAVWLLLCFMSDINNIFAFTVVGVGAAYFLTIIAVFKHSLKTGEFLQAAIMALGVVSCAVMFYCCWIGLGGDALDRILNLSPILVGVMIGFALYRMKLIKMI
jgi:amino acid transporter